MGKFKIEWTEEVWKEIIVVAGNRDEALEKFWNGELDYEFTNVTGGEIQDGVDVSEVKYGVE